MAPSLGLIRFSGLTLAEAGSLSDDLESGIDPEPYMTTTEVNSFSFKKARE